MSKQLTDVPWNWSAAASQIVLWPQQLLHLRSISSQESKELTYSQLGFSPSSLKSGQTCVTKNQAFRIPRNSVPAEVTFFAHQILHHHRPHLCHFSLSLQYFHFPVPPHGHHICYFPLSLQYCHFPAPHHHHHLSHYSISLQYFHHSISLPFLAFHQFLLQRKLLLD
jgi:hypothetical protein